MSLGFGFALPAYPLRGGGGNNPFNQLGPTLDLSFVGTAGDLSGADTYTLNTDFITPEYQVAAQYAVWENGVGLAQKTFSQIVTFSRTSGATWFNSAGVNVGIDFSTSSVTIGTGSKTFTLTATAGIDRSWAAGDIVRISEQATPANFMDGTVTSYTASTQTLVVNVTATGGSGTIASWRVSNWMPRFDYDPATLLARGLLIEEQRTNGIRNNTMQGAVAGTPGTLPQVSGSASWSVVPNGITGMSSSVIGTGIENGITYIDIRINGTPSASVAQGVQILFETQTGVTASASQTWTESAYLKLAAGSTANIANFRFNMQQFNAGVFVQSNSTVITAPSATLTRASATSTLGAGTTTHILPLLGLETTSGAPIDITLRIGLPQLELGAFATSVIPTTVASATRNADVASVNTLSPWFNATAGSWYVETISPPYFGAGYYPTNVQFTDGTSNNTMATMFNTNGAPRAERTASGAVAGSLNTAPVATINTLTKQAFAYALNDFALVANGGTPATSAAGNVPTGLTQMTIGALFTGNKHNSYLRRITYYPRRLTNAELQTITT